MWFVGMLVGLFLGGIAWGFQGAVILGFVGFMAGLIYSSRSPAKPSAPVPRPQDAVSRLEQRIVVLEQRVRQLERRNANEPASAMAGQETQGEGMQSVPGSEPAQARPVSDGPLAGQPSPARLEPETIVPAQVAPAQAVPAQAAATPVAAARRQVEAAESGASDSAPTIPGKAQAAKAAPQTADNFPEQADESLARPNFIVRWFTEGNAIVRVGMTILFIGIAFLIKYAADRDMVPIELRLAGAAAGGIGLLVFGWRLRDARAGYALTLQGAGVAVLYLTIFGAYRIWHVLPAGLAFPLLVAMAVLSALLAIRQDAMVLAIAGTAGGFLAPILASTGQGSHVMLFSYYLILNLGVLAVAWHKTWRPLNLLGFLFTFVIGLAWGYKFYRPEFFASTEPFLIIHFLLYVLVAILFAHRSAPKLAHYVDGTLIFGVPLVAFGLQYGLVRDTEYGLAFSSLALGGFYLALAWWLKLRARPTLDLLVECFLALGVVFGTLAIPLALDARWTSAAWALEGAGIVWIGRRQHRLLARLFGMLLQILAAGYFLYSLSWASAASGGLPVLNSACIGAFLLVLGGLVTYRQVDREDDVTAGEYSLAGFWFGWALFWWVTGGLREVDRFILSTHQVAVAVVFLAATALIGSLLWLRRGWRAAEWPVFLLMPALWLFALVAAFDHGHPFAHQGWVAFPLSLLIHYANLRHHEQEGPPRAVLGFTHAGTALMLAGLGAMELHWLCEDNGLANTGWATAAIILAPLAVLFTLGRDSVAARWPMNRYSDTLLKGAGIPLVVLFVAWSLFANFTRSGSNAPLPYLPLLSAVDLCHVFGGIAIMGWWRRLGIEAEDAVQQGRVAAGVIAFIWINAMLLRCIHHWAGVPYRAHDLWNSMLVQASISLFWTVLALAMMLIASRKSMRALWMLGAGLMAAVVVKLFLVDLSSVDGIARIVSFIGVGILMAVIGYFSPMPPRKSEEASA